MPQLMQSQTLAVSIAASPVVVYRFASNPANLPQWAQGLGNSVELVDDKWIVQSANGSVTVRFAPANEFGVLDHYVTLESGVEVYSPMRVIANGTGSELLFTLFHTPDQSAQQHAEDAKLVARDLLKLRGIIEAQHAG